MTVNVARRSRRPTSATAAAVEADSGPMGGFAPPFTPRLVPGESFTIGEINQTVFDCPSCSRPLALGARRCPGCSAWLVNGVRLSKASAFVAAGLAVGLLAGTGGGFLFGRNQLPTLAAAAVLTPVASSDLAAPVGPSTVPSGAPTASPSAVPETATPSVDTASGGAIPPAARAALVQVVAADDRLAVSGAALESALGAPTFDASNVARILRAVSAESVQDRQLAVRVAAWNGSAAIGTQLGDFYESIHVAAANALISSVRDAAAYRVAATSIVGLLADIPAMDAALRVVASSAGVSLPAAATSFATSSAAP
ncbi:MAG: hypothetical protein QOF49_2165 [Chloroflexota bacterium]|nr:hypothetical protein [Chloroflexota bacterium]